MGKEGGEMSDWRHHLDLSDLLERYSNGEILAPELGEDVAKRLGALVLPIDFRDNVDDLIQQFKEVENIEQFDNAMQELSDLGNTPMWTPPHRMQRKLLWVITC